MKKNLLILTAFFLISFFVFGNNLEVFFAQDDFILINKFSQNSLLVDLKNIFSFSDTHFRPIDNFYFFVLGNVFDKNYTHYHLVSLLVHTLAGFFVFVLTYRIFQKTIPSLVSAFFYLVNSSHFVSLYWISGNAVELGFVLFCVSFLFWMSKRFFLSLTFFVLSILASEAFLLSTVVYISYEFLMNNHLKNKSWMLRLTVLTLFIGVIRFIYLTPKHIYETYSIEFSLRLFSSTKYYLLRTTGFSEMSGDLIVTIVLLLFYGVVIKRLIDSELEVRKIVFFIIILTVGLFPFVLLPYHLSPHYMNLSIFGLSLILALVFDKKSKVNYILLTLFLLISIINVNRLENNHWVVIKSRIAEAYIKQIESTVASTPEGSTLIFNDNLISSSLDAYVALGGGKAINFWFKDKNFKYCFTEFESCGSIP